MSKPRGRKPPDGPRPVGESYLRNSAMHYLSQRSASTSMLRQTLQRRAKRRLCIRSGLPDDVRERIDKVIAALVALGLVNDDAFAENRATALARKGFSAKRIALGLKMKGIVGDRAVRAIGTDINELDQARRFAERKRLGPWRRGGATPETRLKDLRALARAGFSLTVAKQALAEVEP